MSISRLQDRAEIEDTIHRYTRAVDRLDYDAIFGCYFEDSVDTHGSYSGDIPGLVADIRERHAAYESSQHYVMNVLVDFYDTPEAPVDADGHATLARAESYCLCFFRVRAPAGAQTQTQRVSRCRYIDRFERRDGRWAIVDRVVVFDETYAQEITDIRRPEWVAAVRDRSDPLYTWHGFPETALR